MCWLAGADFGMGEQIAWRIVTPDRGDRRALADADMLPFSPGRWLSKVIRSVSSAKWHLITKADILALFLRAVGLRGLLNV
jgi:hypothetical protein